MSIRYHYQMYERTLLICANTLVLLPDATSQHTLEGCMTFDLTIATVNNMRLGKDGERDES